MRHAWLIPAGLSAAGILAGVVAVARGRSGALGVTARKGPRTGAIEVDELEVETRVRQLLDQFDRCTTADGVKGLQPLREGSANRLTVRDAETGEERPVYVLLRPEEFSPWVPGSGVARNMLRRGRLEQEIHIKPNSTRCAPREAWEPFLMKVVAHEAAHASDPALVKALSKRVRRVVTGDEDFATYVNSRAETTAQLVEVEKDLRRSMREQPRLWRDPSPTEVLRLASDRFVEIEPKLTTANRRRYMRLAARLIEERQAKRAPVEDSDKVFRQMQIDEYRKKYASRP
jgi:hypothetical protein